MSKEDLLLALLGKVERSIKVLSALEDTIDFEDIGTQMECIPPSEVPLLQEYRKLSSVYLAREFEVKKELFVPDTAFDDEGYGYLTEKAVTEELLRLSGWETDTDSDYICFGDPEIEDDENIYEFPNLGCLMSVIDQESVDSLCEAALEDFKDELDSLLDEGFVLSIYKGYLHKDIGKVLAAPKLPDEAALFFEEMKSALQLAEVPISMLDTRQSYCRDGNYVLQSILIEREVRLVQQMVPVSDTLWYMKAGLIASLICEKYLSKGL